MTSDRGPRGRIITFYSYKGGTGRTMSLANVGWLLASNGLRVLVMDWDLEAPGLHRYLRPVLIDPGLGATDGLLELFQGYVRQALRPPADGEARDGDWLRACARPAPYVTGTDQGFPGGGRLDLMPPGRLDVTYAAAVTTFNWKSFYDRFGGGTLLQVLREELVCAYDYVLIDSRTGLSDTSSMCTLVMPDTVLCCFVPTRQSIDGTAAVADQVAAYPERSIRVLPVPMRIEDSETARLEAARDAMREAFGGILSWLPEEEHERYWGEVEIPYKPFYAYEEILATVADRPNQPGTLLAAFERLTKWITEGRVTSLTPLPAAEQKRLAEAYLRRP